MLSRLLAVVTLLTSLLVAQCDYDVLLGRGIRGVDGDVNAVAAWDPDGPGPQPLLAVVGGAFGMGGGLAFWDTTDQISGWSLPPDWLKFVDSSGSTGLGRVEALAVYNGELVVAGLFNRIGGASCSNIATWDGSTWNALSGGINGPVRDLAVSPGGELIAVGEFNMAGSNLCRRIAQWDGASWSAIGYGITGGAVEVVAVMPNGDIAVGGEFTMAGFAPANGLGYWDGNSWSALPIGAVNYKIYAMAALPNGDLLVGGDSSLPWPTPSGTIGGLSSTIVRWDGSNWSVPFSWSYEVRDLRARSDGSVVVCGYHWPHSIAIASGSSLQLLEFGSDTINAVDTLPNGGLLIGGPFDELDNPSVPGTTRANGVAYWDGSIWRSPGGGFQQAVASMDRLTNGDVVCVSDCGEVWRWDGIWWHKQPESPVYPGSYHTNPISAIVHPATGNLFVGSHSGVVEWDGVSWNDVTSGAPFGIDVRAMAVASNGDLVAVGNGYFGAGGDAFRWDGISWSSLGLYFPLSTVQTAVVALEDGSLVTAGGSSCYQWSNGTWQVVGSVDQRISCLLAHSSGDVFAGGRFSIVNGQTRYHIAAWNGVSWRALANGLPGEVTALLEMPNGDVLAGVLPNTPGTHGAQIWRWNGSWWTFVWQADAEYEEGHQSLISSMHLTSDGELLVGGTFTTIDGQFSPHIAVIRSTCLAEATVVLGGCGVAVLESESLPWIGATWSCLGSSLPTSSLVIGVTGFELGTVPLAPFFPQAQAGCDLLVDVDLLDAALTVAGHVRFAIDIPNDPALVGGEFHQQLVPFEVDAGFSVTDITATDALSLTIGSI